MTLRTIFLLATAAAMLVPAVAAAQAAGAAKVPAAVAAGSYGCWAHGSARMLLNFKVTGANTYSGSKGNGSFNYDKASGKIGFKGGHLDGVLPDGFVTVYHEPHGKPTVSFRNARGGEVSFCERAGK